MSGRPDLFGDEPDNVCTDGDCFQGKKLAFNERIKAKAREEGLRSWTATTPGHARPAPPAMSSMATTSTWIGACRTSPAPTRRWRACWAPCSQPSALFEHPKEHTLREIVLVSKAIDSLRKNGLLINDPEKDKPRKKKPKEDLGTSVATARDTSHMEPSTPATACG